MGAPALRTSTDGEAPRGAVLFDMSPDQTWVLDADFLYRKLDRLRPIGARYITWIRGINLTCDLLLLGGVLSSFFLVWWSCIPFLGVACLLRAAGRRMVARLAATAAQASTQTFLDLYNTGALWLNQPTSLSSDPERRLR